MMFYNTTMLTKDEAPKDWSDLTKEQYKQKTAEIAANTGIQLNDSQLEKLYLYKELLVEWNSFMNLTGITEFEEVMKKHFIDSVSLVNAVNLENNLSLIDIGTGAGFPGIPLKIALFI